MFTKKQKFLAPEEWVMFKDETGEIVPAIVSEELWDAANAVLRKRSEDVKSRQGICNHANLLTGKLFCTCCGQPYYRKESKGADGTRNSKWVCSGKIKNGRDSCPSFAVYESELQPLLYEVFKDTRADADAMIDEYVRIYTEMTDHNQLPVRIAEHEKRIDNAGRKKSKLLQLSVDGMISDRDFKSMTDQCNAEIAEAEAQIEELNGQLQSSEAFRKKIDGIRRVLAEAQRDAASGVIGKEFVEKYIDKIFVTPEAENAMRLEIRIFTGESTEKLLKKVRSRGGNMTPQASMQEANPDAAGDSGNVGCTGNTFKKMIEAQERQMSGGNRY